MPKKGPTPRRLQPPERPKRRIPQVPGYLAWEEQAPQYNIPEVLSTTQRLEGIHEWQVPDRLLPADAKGTVIKCLLCYAEDGRLIGILNYFPNGSPIADQPGDVTLVVHPEYQRRGIGTRLLAEAVARWPIDLDSQCMTPQGEALVRAFQERQ